MTRLGTETPRMINSSLTQIMSPVTKKLRREFRRPCLHCYTVLNQRRPLADQSQTAFHHDTNLQRPEGKRMASAIGNDAHGPLSVPSIRSRSSIDCNTMRDRYEWSNSGKRSRAMTTDNRGTVVRRGIDQQPSRGPTQITAITFR